MPIPQALNDQIIDLLKNSGYSGEIFSIELLRQGYNNRNYHVITKHDEFLVKHYVTHPHDSRDRLASEWHFIQYATKYASQYIPALLYADFKHRWALFSYVQGGYISPGNILKSDIDQAIDFFLCLNKDEIPDLPRASEACFSISDTIFSIETRLNALKEVGSDTEILNDFSDTLNKILSTWAKVKAFILKSKFFKSHDVLPRNQYCISPSDFGFHNAIKQEDGSIIFVDFEYAGVDDPAKMACDFFSQVSVPVPRQYFDYFMDKTFAAFPDSNHLKERAVLLFPLFQIKWCCIVLNVFLPNHFARLHFLGSGVDESEVYRQQIAKAKRILEYFNG